MTNEFEPSFALCEKLTDRPEVHEAYIAFSDDPTQDQATILASVIIKSYVDHVANRDRYKNIMINGSTRWVTVSDMNLANGEFEGFMAESIYSDVILPMLKGD